MAAGQRMLQPGAKQIPSADVRPQLRAAADMVWGLLAPGIGPGGGTILLKEDVVRPSRALPDIEGSPLLRPYQDLVRRQAAHFGDGAALAGLLAAGTVRAGLDQRRLPGIIEGVRLARRQLAGILHGAATQATAVQALHAVDAELAPLAAQLPTLTDGVLDLDDIHVRCDDVDAPAWSEGLVIEPVGDPTPGRTTIAVVERCVAPLPQAAWNDPAAARAAEAARWELARQTVRELGIDLLVCRKEVPEELAGRLAVAGITHIANAPGDLVRRLAATMGVQVGTQIDLLDADDLGTGDLVRDRKRWSLRGAGAATLQMPGVGPGKQMAIDRAESWLRAVAPIMDDPRVLPGGGRWQRQAAADLRRVADHAPGHAPLGIQLVATVLERIADAVVRNTGDDPTRTPHLEGTDAAVVVEAAVGSALSLAEHVLRIDAAWQKRASAPADLRGGLGKAGSPKGMPGDIPPLM